MVELSISKLVGIEKCWMLTRRCPTCVTTVEFGLKIARVRMFIALHGPTRFRGHNDPNYICEVTLLSYTPHDLCPSGTYTMSSRVAAITAVLIAFVSTVALVGKLLLKMSSNDIWTITTPYTRTYPTTCSCETLYNNGKRCVPA